MIALYREINSGWEDTHQVIPFSVINHVFKIFKMKTCKKARGGTSKGKKKPTNKVVMSLLVKKDFKLALAQGEWCYAFPKVASVGHCQGWQSQ